MRSLFTVVVAGVCLGPRAVGAALQSACDELRPYDAADYVVAAFALLALPAALYAGRTILADVHALALAASGGCAAAWGAAPLLLGGVANSHVLSLVAVTGAVASVAAMHAGVVWQEGRDGFGNAAARLRFPDASVRFAHALQPCVVVGGLLLALHGGPSMVAVLLGSAAAVLGGIAFPAAVAIRSRQRMRGATYTELPLVFSHLGVGLQSLCVHGAWDPPADAAQLRDLGFRDVGFALRPGVPLLFSMASDVRVAALAINAVVPAPCVASGAVAAAVSLGYGAVTLRFWPHRVGIANASGVVLSVVAAFAALGRCFEAAADPSVGVAVLAVMAAAGAVFVCAALTAMEPRLRAEEALIAAASQRLDVPMRSV